MFGIEDIPKFFLAFFLVLPVISILHESGHVFFALLMGGKNIKVTVGTGKVLFQLGMLEVRQYYFWYGLCTFDNIRRKEKLSNILIFSGGALFNLLGTLIIIYLVKNEFLESNIVTYQFTYFSLYYIFFAILPMPYPDGNYSDGKIILDLLKGKDEVVKERTYRIQQHNESGHWIVIDHNKKIINSFVEEENALAEAHKKARENRPSRIINVKDGQEKEIHNYPRIPL